MYTTYNQLTHPNKFITSLGTIPQNVWILWTTNDGAQTVSINISIQINTVTPLEIHLKISLCYFTIDSIPHTSLAQILWTYLYLFRMNPKLLTASSYITLLDNHIEHNNTLIKSTENCSNPSQVYPVLNTEQRTVQYKNRAFGPQCLCQTCGQDRHLSTCT